MASEFLHPQTPERRLLDNAEHEAEMRFSFEMSATEIISNKDRYKKNRGTFELE